MPPGIQIARQIVIVAKPRLQERRHIMKNSTQEPGIEKDPTIDRAVGAAWKLVLFGFVVAGVGIIKAGFSKEGLSLAGLSELGSYLQGTVASLWTLAGLLFIYATFLAQREQMARQEIELANQRKQFEAERAEQQQQIQAQRQQFEKQQKSIERQNFESSFFQLLNLQNQITNGLREISPFAHVETLEGKNCFERWRNPLWENLSNQKLLPDKGELQRCQAAYEIFHKAKQASVAHYFRNLYHVLNFVANSEIEPKRQYTNLVRAQLSSFELILLFYNGLSAYGERIKPLIEKFGMLEHLDKRLLFDPSHERLYAAGAYQ
jgi:hypothetical protein